MPKGSAARQDPVTQAQLAKARHLFEESERVKHYAIADDALASGAEHAAGDELEDEFLVPVNDGVPGVVPAGIARHGVEPFAQHIHNLALALVAPLGAQYHRRLSSHVGSVP